MITACTGPCREGISTMQLGAFRILYEERAIFASFRSQH